MNPYTPPEPSAATIEYVRTPRPIAVWILLIVQLIFIISFVSGFTRFLSLVVAGSAQTNSVILGPTFGFIFAIVWRITLLVAGMALFHATWRRRHWARWAGLVIPLGLTAFSLLSPDNSGQFNDAGKSGAYFAKFFFVPGLLILWAYLCAFSNKAKRYYFPPQMPISAKGDFENP